MGKVHQVYHCSIYIIVLELCHRLGFVRNDRIVLVIYTFHHIFAAGTLHVHQYTLPQKKLNFNFWIFYGDPGPGSVTLGLVHRGEFWNGVFDKLVPGASQELHLVHISLTYTPPQKKGNFRKVAFLLGKSVVRVHLQQRSTPGLPLGMHYTLSFFYKTLFDDS